MPQVVGKRRQTTYRVEVKKKALGTFSTKVEAALVYARYLEGGGADAAADESDDDEEGNGAGEAEEEAEEAEGEDEQATAEAASAGAAAASAAAAALAASKPRRSGAGRKRRKKGGSAGDPSAPPPPEDCGECLHCLDKPKFGGPGRLRHACVLKAKGGLRPHAAKRARADVAADDTAADGASSGSPEPVCLAGTDDGEEEGAAPLDGER